MRAPDDPQDSSACPELGSATAGVLNGEQYRQRTHPEIRPRPTIGRMPVAQGTLSNGAGRRGSRCNFDTGPNVNHPAFMPTRSAISPELELKRSLAASILRKMEEDNLSISALAARIGTGRTAVRRILDAENTSITFRSMSRAAHAVGLKIKLIAEPMSPDELGHLARRLSKSKTKTETAQLTAQITEGFYAGS